MQQRKNQFVAFHKCDGCGETIADTEVSEQLNGALTVDAYCPTCLKENTALKMLVKTVVLPDNKQISTTA